MLKFEEIYRGYVIKEEETNMFLGPDSDRYRVLLRKHAYRFTKEEAVNYLNNNGFFLEKDKHYYIEDAS